MERVQMKRDTKEHCKDPKTGNRGVRLWRGCQHFPWLSLWPRASHFFLRLSFSIHQHGKFEPHYHAGLLWDLTFCGIKYSLYFSYFPQVKEQFVDLLRSSLSPKSILCLACWNFLGDNFLQGLACVYWDHAIHHLNFGAGMALEFYDAHSFELEKGTVTLASLLGASGWIAL